MNHYRHTLLVLALLAQTAQCDAGIYSCIDDKGRHLTADRPIPECTNREQKLLNRDGSVRSVQLPIPTVEERAIREAVDRANAEAKAVQVDAVRRDRNLIARYPNETVHSQARESALDTVRLVVKGTENRLRDLMNERKPLLTEAEFYVGKILPPKLRNAMDANTVGIEALRSAIVYQTAEIERINKIYDVELVRLRALWNGAQPGSPGWFSQP